MLSQASGELFIPVDERVATLIPFRGSGGARGGSFRYISASDLLRGQLPADSLMGKRVLVGTTAPGLLDLRVTPVGQSYLGVETHVNGIAGLMGGRVPVKLDHASGFEILILVVIDLTRAFAMPVLSATRAVVFSVLVIGLTGGYQLLAVTEQWIGVAAGQRVGHGDDRFWVKHEFWLLGRKQVKTPVDGSFRYLRPT